MADAQKSRSRLGRGLSSLMSLSLPVEADVAPVTPMPPQPAPGPVPDARPAPVGGPTELALTSISPNPHQPRRDFSDASLAELAASMKANGVIQPVVVRPVPDPSASSGQAPDPSTSSGQAYQLIAGERRYRAAKLAGLETIPAIVRDVDSFTQAQLALVENIQREDLNPIDRAQGYRALLNQLGLTQAELAGRLGEDRSTIANFLRLLDLSPVVQAEIRAGRLSVGHAKLLAGVSDTAEQERLAKLVVGQELSVRNLERLLSGNPPAVIAKPVGQSAHVLDLEKSIARQLGMRVQVRAMRRGRGRLVIHYASLDQFDGLLARLGVQLND